MMDVTKRKKTTILGVTGGIASGKSTVARLFATLGATVVSADELAREAVRPGSAALKDLVGRFGPGILDGDGGLDRKALAAVVFADPQARQDLNRITHPAIALLASKRLARLVREGSPLVVYEAPLLFEAGAEGRVDRVLTVTVDEQQQLKRLMERDGLDEAAARQRVDAQMPQAEKAARADYVIDNSGSLAQVEAQVRALFRQLAEAPPETPKS